MLNLAQTVAPASEPLTLAEAKAHLRVDGTDDDTLITALIVAAREQCEAYLRRSLITQQWQLKLDRWFDTMPLPLPPLISVESVKYIDTDGTEQTLATSVYDVDTAESLVRLAYDQNWPTARTHAAVITIDYTTGYGAAAAVPDSIKSGLYMLIGHLYENRELSAPIAISTVPWASTILWWPYRWINF